MKSNKLILLILCIGLIIPFQLEGQTPWLTNGNTVSPTDFLGTTNNQVLNFKTNGAFRMRLMNTTGYLGVGSQTFTPSASLHLNLLSYTINSGKLIRTDGKSSLDLSWAMYSGTNVGNSVQKARFLLSPSTDTQNDDNDTGMFNDAINHLQVESTLGDIVFQAHGANSSVETGQLTERMRVTSMIFNDPHWEGEPNSITRVSISGRPDRPITEPLAMLHIGEPWDYVRGGHRDWMNSGVYANRDNDNVFFGMRPREKTSDSDDNDAIIAWGDNDGPPGREDGLRVVFCGPYSGSANPGEGAHENGLETMRFHPLGNIGMGDFSINGLDQTPTEKLDIVGKLRVRDVPVNLTPEVLIVGQEIDSDGDYVLNHLSFPDDDTKFLSGTGEWLNVGSTGGDFDWETDGINVWTGTDLPSSPYPPGKVGIGIAGYPATAKLDVSAKYNTSSFGTIAIKAKSHSTSPLNLLSMANNNEATGGIHANYGSYTLLSDDNTANNIGSFHKIWSGASVTNSGVEVLVYGAGTPAGTTGVNVGFSATASPAGSSSPNIALINYGIKAKACGATTNYGVYGETCTTGGSDYAGYFNGDVYSTTGMYLGSDLNIKEDIQDIPNPSEILNSLNPQTYYFQNHETLTLSESKQYGLIAQELEEVLPELVQDAILPAEFDSLGNVTREQLTTKAVRYNDLIPILIAGFKEQNTIVDNQQAQIAIQNETIANLEALLEAQASEMEQQGSKIEQMQNDMQSVLSAVQTMQQKTANCCTPKTGTGETGAIINESQKELELEQNVPNPFDDQTRIAFYLPQTADIILEITDAAGRPLERLIDGKMSNGEHTTLWDGSKVASGIYFYTLYADGQLITKKMIKH